MRASLGSWLLLICSVTLVSASGILEVDLLFPRNETYAPTEKFPIVFAIQNAQLAPLVDLAISFDFRDRNNGSEIIHSGIKSIWSNETATDPFLYYTFRPDFQMEGHWSLVWSAYWKSCNEYASADITNMDRANIIHNTSSAATVFTTENSAPKVDLVSATANRSCPGEFGVPINVTDHTIPVPTLESWGNGDVCAVVESSPTLTPDPCRVNISPAMVESMEADFRCRGIIDQPDDCSQDKESAAQKVAVVGMSSLLAVFGAVGLMVMHI